MLQKLLLLRNMDLQVEGFRFISEHLRSAPHSLTPFGICQIKDSIILGAQTARKPIHFIKAAMICGRASGFMVIYFNALFVVINKLRLRELFTASGFQVKILMNASM